MRKHGHQSSVTNRMSNNRICWGTFFSLIIGAVLILFALTLQSHLGGRQSLIPSRCICYLFSIFFVLLHCTRFLTDMVWEQMSHIRTANQTTIHSISTKSTIKTRPSVLVRLADCISSALLCWTTLTNIIKVVAAAPAPRGVQVIGLIIFSRKYIIRRTTTTKTKRRTCCSFNFLPPSRFFFFNEYSYVLLYVVVVDLSETKVRQTDKKRKPPLKKINLFEEVSSSSSSPFSSYSSGLLLFHQLFYGGCCSKWWWIALVVEGSCVCCYYCVCFLKLHLFSVVCVSTSRLRLLFNQNEKRKDNSI